MIRSITLIALLLVCKFEIFPQTKIGLSFGANFSKLITYKDTKLYRVDIQSNIKHGLSIESDVSKKSEDWFLIEAGLTFNHMITNAQTNISTHLFIHAIDGDYKINTFSFIIKPSFRFSRIGLYLNTGFYLGYLDCRFSGVEYSQIVGLPKKNINNTGFNGLDFGYNLEVKFKKEFEGKFDVFIGAGYLQSLIGYTQDELSYKHYQIRIGIMTKI